MAISRLSHEWHHLWHHVVEELKYYLTRPLRPDIYVKEHKRVFCIPSATFEERFMHGWVSHRARSSEREGPDVRPGRHRLCIREV